MTEMQDKDDEHFAPESGERDEDQAQAQADQAQETDPQHAADDEHYAPES